MPDTRVVLATIGAPHGVRGEVRVRAWTDEPMALKDYAPLTLPDGRPVAIVSLRPHKDALVARLQGVDTREAAALLTNLDILVPRDALPEAEEGEFLLDDLIGLRARSADGGDWGRVVATHDFGAGEVLEIAPPGRNGTGRTAMIPFSEAAVPEIDVEAGTLIVEPVAAGLVDPEDDAQGDDAEGGDAEGGDAPPSGAR